MLGDDLGGFEPQRAVFLIGVAPIGEQLHGLCHIAALVELGLKEPLVVLNAVAAQVGLHLGDVPVQTEAGHGLVAALHVLLQIFFAVSVVEGLGQVLDIVAVVAVLGKLHLVLAQNQLLIAGVDGGGEFLDLVAGVVHIELPPDLIAGPVQHAGQRVAQNAASGIAHVHGAGGVGGDKLHHQPLAVAHVHPAVVRALSGDISQHVGIPALRKAEVDKAGACHLHRGKPAALQLHVGHQGLRDLPGGHVQGLGPGHGVVCGVIAVGGILGDLNAAGKRRTGGQLAFFHGLVVGGGEYFAYPVLGALNHVSHLSVLLSVPLH